MIYDMRVYTCRPGTIKKAVALYQEHGFGPQTRNLGKPVIWATTEVGDVNQFVHVWAYENLAERDAKRAAMWADPEWVAYTQKVAEMGALVKQENRILVAAPFAL